MTEPNLADVIRSCPHLSESVHRTEERREEKKRTEERGTAPPAVSPSPEQDTAKRVWQILDGGVASLSEVWRQPNRATIARLLTEHGPDLCLKAAREAREIVQAQDRAPNVTGLFAKKLRDLSGVRDQVRESIGGTDA
jgi:hypothetical protein